ncbi:MAG: ATP-dependent RNA helicase HrpA, partial [Desulfobacterales bacterium]
MLGKIEALVPQALARDRPALRRKIAKLARARARSSSEPIRPQALFDLEKQIQASVEKRVRRQEDLPPLNYNDALPITAKKDEIIRAIAQYSVVIVSGETGSGKTTQLPKFCLAAGRGIDGVIGCTQPRRIAATAVARRIAEEFGQELGQAVGYKIRFKDRTAPGVYIKIMTDGMLLAETQNDRYLRAYDTLIVDEAHERSLNIDFILGILQNLLTRRDDLKLIITSATIDTEKFSKAFGRAPVIEVSGRMYPVEVQYYPPDAARPENGDTTHVELAAQAVQQIERQTPGGDILVFMPTEQDIRETCEMIEAGNPKGACVLPLYARLTAAEQSRVFARTAARKIIVATNVAETSITIPGIKYVIDSGLARISRYAPRSRTTSLPVVPISKSSADQRKGRCGRVENGVCIRLFAEEDYEARPLFTPPEILRANLAEVILRMIALRLGDISTFPFIDRPDLKSVNDGFNLLFELGAIVQEQKAAGNGQGAGPDWRSAETPMRLTARGRLMAKMPLDPRLSRMLLEAHREGCVDAMAVIAAALSVQDPRERPAEKTREADQRHAAFNDPYSDFVTLLNIWHRYHATWRESQSQKQMKRFCRENYLSYKRMREWRDVYSQITAILQEFGIWNGKCKRSNTLNGEFEVPNSKSDKIHRSILSGFLSNIAVKKDHNIYRAARGREAMIFPGSTLFNKA